MTEARYWQEDGIDHLDVREMEPPGPFVAILGRLEGPDCGSELIVHLSRDPVFLFPELSERHWSWVYLSESPGDIVLHLSKINDQPD